MEFADHLFAVWLGRLASPDTVTIGLAFRGVELAVGGYERQRTDTADWVVSPSRVTSPRVEFGPVTAPVTFDETWLFVGDEVVDRASAGVDRSLLPSDSIGVRHFAAITHA
jgi:hypothetical protein